MLYVRITAIFTPQFHLLKAKYQETQANLKGFQKQSGESHHNTIASSTSFFPHTSKHTPLRICLCHKKSLSVRRVNRKFIN